MKKIAAVVLSLSILSACFATTTVEIPKLNAANVILPVGKTGKTISLLELSRVEVTEFERLTERKLGFLDRIGFKLGQKKLQQAIDHDGTIKKKKLNKLAAKMANGETGFHIGGFALGFLLGLIGVLIAYLINDEVKSNRVKWAWIGLGAVVVLSLILFLI